MATYCVTKCPKKSPFSRGDLNLLISLILHDKARFYPSGMKLATESTAMSSKLRRDEIFEKCSILVKVKEGKNFNHRNISNISRIEILT